ncbi:hypothetical protein QQF64_006468 [Cirrhinus molitorella]|uniref:Reverse transcriptase domain-containing protein n=1 Tax=Cirrhinus molitorella TaxID=172907 RepID=A0ABR3MI89_9TELE
MATESLKGKIPLESARAGVEDDSSVDHTVIDPGTETTMNQMFSTGVDGETVLAGHKFQNCICGWKKITSEKGLKIHQGRKKCLRKPSEGPRIDHYFLRGRANQSSEAQWQDIHHSPQGIRTPDEAQPGTESPTDISPEPIQPQTAVERKMNGRKPQILWPKSCQKKEWETTDTDLVHLLEGLKGCVERKLDKIGEIIYSYGVERFGVKSTNLWTQKDPSVNLQSRRQQEIEQLVKERRNLRKQWRKATEVERKGLEALQGDIKQRIAILRRAECLRKQHKKKERARTAFYRDPYKFVKDLFIKEKTGTLKVPIRELEEYLRKIYSDNQRHVTASIPDDMPPIQPPEHQLETRPPTWSEVESTVKRARTASAPGPNGIPYRLYKNAPGVLKYLWKLMKVAWEKGIIPKAWRRAGGILIPKEKNSSTIDQFRQISLLNVEGKIFFSVVAQRISVFLQKNNFVDISVQKAGISGFSGCLEHTNVIWHQIQTAKKEKKDLHVVFLDLANAFGSVPHEILWTAFSFFQVPEGITRLVKVYFQDLQFCVTAQANTTAWQHLEIGIMAGCTISPLAFTMAMELIIRASRWVVGGERLKSGLRLPPIRAYMDDMTTITTTSACTKRLLDKLQGNIKWARMEIKPNKSRSISIVKGQLTNERFQINNEPIPTVLEKPIKSLGRWYSAELKDSKQVEQLRQDTISGLNKINNTDLPGKLKLWCFQFGLLPRLMWPISIYEVTLTHANRLERLVNAQVRKCLGLPRCLTSIGLYGNGALSLPISSLVEEYKCAKSRLEMTLTDSRDPVVRGAAPTLVTGRKWKPSAAVAVAKAAVRHRDIVGHVQHGRGGFGSEAATPTWQKATPTERRHMVVEEVRRQEEAARCAKAVSQAQQGRWMKWDGVERRKIAWSEMWGMEANRLSFIIRATYDVLPSPTNLHLWHGEDPACPLCAAPATLKHILVGCKTSLTQGRYTWRHNQVLKCLAAEIENKRVIINGMPLNAQATIPRRKTFMREGEKQRTTPSLSDSGPLNAARDWEMRVDLSQRLTFPPEIAVTNLRPDLVLWAKSCRRVFIVEMTVPWEDAINEAFERKRLRYANLAAEAEGRGWNVKVWPVEVGCRGFVARSTTRLLKEVGIRGQSQRRAIKELANVAEQSSHWLWLKRRDTTWAAK